MSKALQGEIYKLTRNPGFKIYCVFISLIMIGETVYSYNLWKYYTDIFLEYRTKKLNPYPQVLSQYWIGGDISSVFLELYYIFFPIIAVLPFAITYYSEIKNGYAKNVCVKVGKKNYIIAKSIVTYIAGGLACACPLCVNLWITSLYAPNIPQQVTNMTSAVISSGLWPDLFYDKPVAYAFIYIGLAFLFGGLMAAFTMIFAYCASNVFVYCVTAFLMNISAYYLLFYTEFLKFVPRAFLNPSQPLSGMTYSGIAIAFLALLLITVVGIYAHTKKQILR